MAYLNKQDEQRLIDSINSDLSQGRITASQAEWELSKVGLSECADWLLTGSRRVA